MNPLLASESSFTPLPPRRPVQRQDTVTWQPFFSRVAFPAEIDAQDTVSEANSNTIDDTSSLTGLTEHSSPATSSLELDHDDRSLESSDQETSDNGSSSDRSSTSSKFGLLYENQLGNKPIVPAIRKRPRRCRTLMQPSWDGQECRYLLEYKPSDVVVMDVSTMPSFFKSAHGIATEKTSAQQSQAQSTGTSLPGTIAVVLPTDQPCASKVDTSEDSSPTRLSISHRPLATVHTLPKSYPLPDHLQLQAHYFVTLKNPNADMAEQLIGVTHSITGSTQHIFPDKQHFNDWQAQSDEERSRLALDNKTIERMIRTANELLEATHNHAKGVKLELPNRTLDFCFV